MLEEYAIRFYALLDQGLKVQADRNYMNAVIAMLPHMEDDARSDVMTTLEYACRDMLDSRPDDDYSGLELLKKELGTQPDGN